MSPGAYITTDCCCRYVSAAVQQHLLREAHIVLKKITFFTHKQKRIVKKETKRKARHCRFMLGLESLRGNFAEGHQRRERGGAVV